MQTTYVRTDLAWDCDFNPDTTTVGEQLANEARADGDSATMTRLTAQLSTWILREAT